MVSFPQANTHGSILTGTAVSSGGGASLDIL
jgi:hypothetical protein